jgi:hypothetical protein
MVWYQCDIKTKPKVGKPFMPERLKGNKKVALHVRIPKDLYDTFRMVAKIMGYPLNTYVAILIRQELNRQLEIRDITTAADD